MEPHLVVAEPVSVPGGLGVEAQAGLIAVAKKQYPLPARQRQVSARSPGRRLEANTAKASAQYCNRMVVDAAERGELEEALMRIRKLRAEGLQPNSEAFNALPLELLRIKDIDSAEEWPVTAFNALLLELLRVKDIDSAEEWLGKAATSALNPDLAGLEANATTYNALVTSLAQTGQMPKAEKYAREAQGKGLELDSGTYHALAQACMNMGECRRAHTWCTEMVEVGHKKPNKAMMKSLIWALTDAGNTTSANHWLKFMAQESSDLDHRTYEHVRAAHPLDIVPTGLSGEVGASVPPVVRPATVGAERRTGEPAGARPEASPATPRAQTAQRPAWLNSPRRNLKGMRLEPIHGQQAPSKNGGDAAKASSKVVQSWLRDMGTGDAWRARKGLGPAVGGGL